MSRTAASLEKAAYCSLGRLICACLAGVPPNSLRCQLTLEHHPTLHQGAWQVVLVGMEIGQETVLETWAFQWMKAFSAWRGNTPVENMLVIKQMGKGQPYDAPRGIHPRGQNYHTASLKKGYRACHACSSALNGHWGLSPLAFSLQVPESCSVAFRFSGAGHQCTHTGGTGENWKSRERIKGCRNTCLGCSVLWYVNFTSGIESFCNPQEIWAICGSQRWMWESVHIPKQKFHSSH